MRALMTVLVAVMGLAASSATADPYKDESGKGKWRAKHFEHSYARGERREIRIPKGHMPPPGECRRWYPDRPAGHQPPPFRC